MELDSFIALVSQDHIIVLSDVKQLSLSIINGNSEGCAPLETQPQSWLIMRWVTQGPGTHQLPSGMVKVCYPLFLCPMTILMCINLRYFLGLCLHLHLLVITLYLILSYPFPPRMCPPSWLPPKFWMMICPYLSSGQNMMLVYYHLLHFHNSILTLSVLHVILFYLDLDWKWNWNPLWCFGCFLVYLWNHHIQAKLISQESII